MHRDSIYILFVCLITVVRPFQENFTYVKPIVKQRSFYGRSGTFSKEFRFVHKPELLGKST